MLEAAPTVEGVADQTASQDSQPSVQTQAESQETGQRQVETNESQATSQTESRPRASDFVLNRKVKNIERNIGQMMELLKQSQQQKQNTGSAAVSQTELNERYQHDPVGVVTELIQNALGQVVPKSLQEHLGEREFDNQRQEAKKLILSNELVKKDQEAIEKIQDILQDENYNLDEFSLKNPLAAARIALAIYESRYKPSTQSRIAPKKSEMTSVATGGMPKGKVDVRAEGQRLLDQLSRDQNLATDPKFMEQLNNLTLQARSNT